MADMSAPGSPRSVCESPLASRSPSPQAVPGHARSPEASPRPERKSFSISDILSRSDPVRERLDDTQKLLDAAAAARYGGVGVRVSWFHDPIPRLARLIAVRVQRLICAVVLGVSCSVLLVVFESEQREWV